MGPVTFQSYIAADRFFSTCRSVYKGKPLPGQWRMHKRGDVLTIGIPHWRGDGTTEICRITPDNVVEFTLSQENMLSNSNSLTMVLWKVVPLLLQRKRTNLYDIGTFSNKYYPELNKANKCEYFTGVKFNLQTGECLNPQPDILSMADPVVKREWLRTVKRFKKGLKIRAKIGALQGFVRRAEEDAAADKWNYRKNIKSWTDTGLTQHLLECMRQEDYAGAILLRFAQEAIYNRSWRNTRSATVTDQDVLDAVDRVFNAHSLHLRKQFGVFGDEQMQP